MTFSIATPLSFRLATHSRRGLLLLSTAAALLLMSEQARSTDSADGAPVTTAAATATPVPAAAVQAETPAPTPAPTPSVTAAAPRYSASNLAMAFNYMDANRDGKVSREEAAGFRGVAKNFDRADTNHDNILSRGEFDRAMNYVKPQ